jgi:putative DNA primase/helicase
MFKESVMKTEEILSRLYQVKRNGNGWTAICPAHADKSPSLSVKKEIGKTLVRCFAECPVERICEAIGIEVKDLFDNSIDFETNGLKPRQEMSERKVTATYDYTDEHGNLLFQTIRYEPKDFRQRRPDRNGGWIWNLKDTRFVLYRLPEVVASQLVYLVEGEKDVETIRAHALPATCNPMGAGKWRDEYSESLRGKTVVILRDNDQPGLIHAEKVASRIFEVAQEVVVVDLPNLPEKGDVSDYFQNGGTVDELIDLVARAESWKLPENKRKQQSVSKFNFTSLNELLNEPEEETAFVWEGTLPFGGLSICSAKPKVGKSTVARNLAINIVSGEPFLGRATIKGKVIYLCLEEKRNEVRNHFERMGVKSDDILIHTGATPENALEELAIAIAEFEPVLVIIDPLSRVLRVKDFNDYGTMARAFEPLIDLARKTNCHILALHHDSKMDRSGGDALLGSTAIFGAVDCHIQLKKRDKGRTILTTQRYGEDMPETVIELDKDTGIISSQGDLQSVIFLQVKDKLIQVIDEGEEKTEQQIKEQIEGVSQGIISRALRELVEESIIRRQGEGKKGSPYIYSKIQL